MISKTNIKFRYRFILITLVILNAILYTLYLKKIEAKELQKEKENLVFDNRECTYGYSEGYQGKEEELKEKAVKFGDFDAYTAINLNFFHESGGGLVYAIIMSNKWKSNYAKSEVYYYFVYLINDSIENSDIISRKYAIEHLLSAYQLSADMDWKKHIERFELKELLKKGYIVKDDSEYKLVSSNALRKKTKQCIN